MNEQLVGAGNRMLHSEIPDRCDSDLFQSFKWMLKYTDLDDEAMG